MTQGRYLVLVDSVLILILYFVAFRYILYVSTLPYIGIAIYYSLASIIIP